MQVNLGVLVSSTAFYNQTHIPNSAHLTELIDSKIRFIIRMDPAP